MRDYFPTTFDDTPLRDRLFLVLAVLLLPLWLPLLVVFWAIYGLRRQFALAVRGFWVAGKGRDNFEYQERRGGKIARIFIYGERILGGPSVVYVPADDDWRQSVPEWARDRREEIFARIRWSLGSKNYEYVDYEAETPSAS